VFLRLDLTLPITMIPSSAIPPQRIHIFLRLLITPPKSGTDEYYVQPGPKVS
jgi:hypothetical protein